MTSNTAFPTLAILGLLVLPAGAAGQGTAGSKPAAFERLSVAFYPGAEAAGTGAPVWISLRGQARPGGTEVPFPLVGAASLSPAQATVADYLQALTSGVPDRIASFWNPPEKDLARSRMDAETLRKSEQFIGSVAKVRFTGEVVYGNYRIVLAELVTPDKSYPRAYPLRQAGDRFYVTDELSSDLFFSVLASPLAERLARPSTQVKPEGGQPR